MKDRFGLKEKVTASAIMGAKPRDGFKLSGIFSLKHFRDGKLIGETEGHNIITGEGLIRMMDVFFGGAGANNTQTATWYVGIYNDDNPALDGDENYDVPVFTEDVDYDEATRPAYVEAGATAGFVVTNTASPAVFTTTTGGQTIYGAAIFSINTKGDHAPGANNRLFCCAQFALSRAVLAADVLNVTYAITGADDGV